MLLGDKENKNRNQIGKVSGEADSINDMVASFRKRSEEMVHNVPEPEVHDPRKIFERHAKTNDRSVEKDAERIRRNIERKLTAEEKRAYASAKKIAAERQRTEKKAIEEERKKIAERQRRKKKEEHKEFQRIIEEQRALQKKKREETKREYEQVKHELEEQLRREKEEKGALKKQLRKQRKIAKKSAELGAGIVKVHGTEVSTEVQLVPSFSWREYLGHISRKKIREAESPEELDQLIRDAEVKRIQARETAVKLAKLRKERRNNNPVVQKFRELGEFCDKKKAELLIALSVLILIIVITGTFINNFSVYEYSYNGKTLGYVKNRDDVLQITEMVRDALTEERNQEVVIDARNDIKFKRILVFDDDITIDRQDDVLRRLTYMGDLNVKAYGIYIDGKKAGAVANKEVAADVLGDIKDIYASGKKGSEVIEAVITDDIEIKKSNTDVEDIKTRDEMVEILCTSGTKETTHTVVVGETLSDIATDYGLQEKDILSTNENIDPKKLEVGSPILIIQKAPLLSVKVTEKRTYDQTIEYEVEEKKTDELYRGTTRIERKGENGSSHIVEETVYVNGEVSDNRVISKEVTKEPVAKIVSVGTAKTPPTTGTGTYIWPTNGSYRISSRYGPRWGRNHDGIDMACSMGTDVLASDGGTVIEAGYHGSYGNLVVIDHQNGVHTYYAHNSKLLVRVGDKVYQGKHIAESGSTGRSTGPHIHFGVKVNGSFRNPENYLP